jgi:acyl carrier protein
MSEVADKVKKIIAEHLGIDDMSKITDDAKFIDDLGADSLDTVELVMAFEESCSHRYGASNPLWLWKNTKLG